MKRFVTYLYAYRNGQKIKNTGHIRVDVRGKVLDMRISISDAELDNLIGNFYIVIKKESSNVIRIDEIPMKNGLYNGRIICDSDKEEKHSFQWEDIIGVCLSYENGSYLASCWKDGEEDVIAEGRFWDNEKLETGKDIDNIVNIEAIEKMDDVVSEGSVTAAAIFEEEINLDINEDLPHEKMKFELQIESKSELEVEPCYRKINLSEIYTLPSNYWHFSNNSFLLHGFWNYGYLVVKENVEEIEKKILLGVPGIFEQPEMVMASYFGFPAFEKMPSQMETMEIGEVCSCECEKNQLPQEGAFGCWFTKL